MTSFISAPLQVPIISNKMEELEKCLESCFYEVKPLCMPNVTSMKIDDNVDIGLKFVKKQVKIQFSSEFSESITKKKIQNVNCQKLEAFLIALQSSASNDFCLLGEAIVGSLELSYGDLMTYDKIIYHDLIISALSRVKKLSVMADNVECKPSSIYVASFENDFLLIVRRIMRTFSQGKTVILSCASKRLMVPLFIFVKIMISAGPPEGLLSFIPIKKTESGKMPFSSIQMIFESSDMDSAARSIVKASAYHAGTTSWRPSVVLVQQAIEHEFHSKVKTLISEVTARGDATILDKNSHLRSHCQIPYFIKSNFDSYVNSSSIDGAEIVRPNQDLGPVFIFGLTPASAMLEKHMKFPLGPCSLVIPFRTVNESIKLAMYFSDREKCIVGADELINGIPKSAIIWTDNSALALQVLAKLTGYTTLAVNSTITRLCSSYYLSDASHVNCVNFPGFAIPKDELCQIAKNDMKSAAELMKIALSTDKITLTLKKMSFDQRLFALKSWKDFSIVAPLLEKLRLDCLSHVNIMSQQTMNEEIITEFTAERLLLLRKMQEPGGPLFVILTSSDLLPELVQLSICSLILGNPVVLIAPNGVTSSAEVKLFCDAVSLAGSKNSIVQLNNLIQLQTVSMGVKETIAVLSGLPFTGVCCISAPVDTIEMADFDIETLCKHTSIFWSVGGDLFAN